MSVEPLDPPKPGDLIKFFGIIGLDRSPCLVIAVYAHPDVEYPGKRVLMLTKHCRLFTDDMGEPDDDRHWVKMNDE